ncbi:APC family permease [Alteribacillus bidgolensis]|uniref:Amino acid/polyamine/organocation transporter, APC superfamily n=1 Tax=Alteribacillus bidgolensis TaxID=930129 RepID=A0A1G8R3M4_9BACI|nr:APC family permease [Alteribacillus bidgolensis]SDJ11571.1 amino acid/polyamine/organocation transporter, APC superfamily [Alteribacillus bidgolensis]
MSVDKSSSAEVLQKSGQEIQSSTDSQAELKRDLTWKDAFWFSSGVPALVLFSIGAIAATVGNISWLVWAVSISIGFLQAFTYAEIAGLYPNKAGGASVYGSMAWIKYSKLAAAMSMWCNWLAWTPVLALGTSLAAAYVFNSFFAGTAFTAWELTLLNLEWVRPGLTMRLNGVFILAVVLLFVINFIQNLGALKAARFQNILAIIALLPLILVGIIPLFTGGIQFDNLLPFAPLSGSWDMAGWTLLFGGMFLAAWSTYAFETAICYTGEFKDPKKDTFKAIISAGILCIVMFTLVPFSFQNALGLEGLLNPGVVSGEGVGSAMADMVGGGIIIGTIIILLLILALIMAVMTSLAGASRTLYQASVDGFFPKSFSGVNKNGAPSTAMWVGLVLNVFLLSLSDYTFVLAISNVNYLLFNFLNLNAGWIHRIDRANWSRPFKVPNWLLVTNVGFAFLNMALLGMGADIWGKGTLWAGLFSAALVIPFFVYRHYFIDKGEFAEGIHDGVEDSKEKKAGIWPYIALATGIVVILIAHNIAVY